MAKIIAFSNQKGGVGKTTSCVNFSAYLAAAGRRVLLVDADPQGNATSGLGVAKNEIEKSIYDALLSDAPIREVILKTEVDGLDVAPSNIDLAGAEIELVSEMGREKRLAQALTEVAAEYDYVTVDCPPSLGLLTINALAAADSVIIPIQSEFYALEGLTQLINSFKLVKRHLNANLEIDGVVLTMFDSRSLISNQIREQITRYFGAKLFSTVIPRNVRLAEAPSHGVPVLLHDDRCAGAKAYRALAEEYIRRCERK